MQEKRKKKQEKEAKRLRKIRAKQQFGGAKKGRVGGGVGGKNNAYGVGA